MKQNDHRRVIAELDALAKQVTGTIQRFEATGFTAVMKEDYVELHKLECRILEMRLVHTQAIDATAMCCDISLERH